MKIKIAIIICFLLACFLSGCGYKGYSGDNTDLYTVAINSVLWNNGHSYKTDKATDSQIEILEQDKYGRTIFTYYEKYYAGAKLSFSALIISQTVIDDCVYYYEDVNFIIKRQELYASQIVKFSQEEIENLKTTNDWGYEINLKKCVKKFITKTKEDIPCNAEIIKDSVKREFGLIERQYSLFLNYLTCDYIGNFIFYGSIIKSDGENLHFVALYKSENDIRFLVPDDLYDYRQELIGFKIQNGWKVS